MSWRSNRYNKKSSKDFGWSPSWLGMNEFNDDLHNAIIRFQVEHDLKPDGYVGINTFRRLQISHEAAMASPEGQNNVLIRDRLKPIAWHKTKKDLLPPNCYKNHKKERKPHVIVTHWDVCTSAASCKRVLEKRNISTHFVIDNDGTIVQLVDTNNIAWHAKGANKYSIGVDISCAYYTKYMSVYTKKGLGQRPLLSNSTVHGRKLPTHMGYYPIQIQAYTALIRFLCETYGIPLDYPKDDEGFLCTTVHKQSADNKFAGVVNHYNLTKNKIDTAGLRLDKIINNIRELES